MILLCFLFLFINFTGNLMSAQLKDTVIDDDLIVNRNLTVSSSTINEIYASSITANTYLQSSSITTTNLYVERSTFVKPIIIGNIDNNGLLQNRTGNAYVHFVGDSARMGSTPYNYHYVGASELAWYIGGGQEELLDGNGHRFGGSGSASSKFDFINGSITVRGTRAGINVLDGGVRATTMTLVGSTLSINGTDYMWQSTRPISGFIYYDQVSSQVFTATPPSGGIGTESDPAFNLFQSTGQSLIRSWELYKTTGEALTKSYGIFVATAQPIIESWNLYKTTGESLTKSYSIFVATGQSKIDSWTLARSTVESKIDSWTLSIATNNSKHDDYNLFRTTAQPKIDSWTLAKSTVESKIDSWTLARSTVESNIDNTKFTANNTNYIKISPTLQSNASFYVEYGVFNSSYNLIGTTITLSGNTFILPSTAPANDTVLSYNNGRLVWGVDDSGGGAGDNLGNHTATQDLNLSSFSVTNVSSIAFNNGLKQFNPADEIITSTYPNAAITTMTVVFSTRPYQQIIIYSSGTSATTQLAIRFNNDPRTIYAVGRLVGATLSTVVSTSVIPPHNANDTNSRMFILDIPNNSPSTIKAGHYRGFVAGTAAANAPIHLSGTFAFHQSTSPITQVSVFPFPTNPNATHRVGSYIAVKGFDIPYNPNPVWIK